MNLSLDFILQLLIVSLSLGLILLSSKLGQTLLENSPKIITGAAASTTIYNNFNKDGSGSSPVREVDKKDKSKNKNKDNKMNQKIAAINNMIQIIKNNIHKYKESFSFAFLLSYLDLNIPNDAEPITQISFGFLILGLIVLTCFTNVIGYLSFILLIKYYKLGDKYPKFNKFLSLFEKSSIIAIVIEGLVGYIFLFAIIIFSFLGFTQSFT